MCAESIAPKAGFAEKSKIIKRHSDSGQHMGSLSTSCFGKTQFEFRSLSERVGRLKKEIREAQVSRGCGRAVSAMISTISICFTWKYSERVKSVFPSHLASLAEMLPKKSFQLLQSP
jgi:hypothetical protein